MSTIMPVSKKTGARQLNDLRPVALSSVIAKCLELLIASKKNSTVEYLRKYIM